jgi:hypothetical protein
MLAQQWSFVIIIIIIIITIYAPAIHNLIIKEAWSRKGKSALPRCPLRNTLNVWDKTIQRPSTFV